ncbi:ABC spermidine/putrescine transporter, ATPase subunit [Oceanicola granulosus HTCC2516]|uniref:ABC spermidine/putrescine transporter, ATPase subunit n=1 Tax=Oceanicola granulosus (strain ATCC BAA-861 / DSM 15982 / KCTC 12143 / HTCC2516) TaxID=314256 RepID=Q2CEA0_OCEGH|nr:ABC transporter ATP-binding protein [Oceanicola granulosus]EAR50960.1 ABC spermidine/putrescine transporter, ATPase subunit [Oceanicola granulosus HTCC2516]
MTDLITLSGVHKYYGDYHALRGIDLTIRQGEFFSLLGPSGCGKTTLLRTIAGFEDASSGSLTIDGRDMKRVEAHHRPTNMVFQSYAIFPHLSVAENVGFGLRRDKRARADKARAVGEALEMVGLAGYGNRRANALSGGQRQRVALARALILEPKVLLLDEPLSALDKKMREQMQVELMRLQREVGITFILVTHDQEEALVMSDRIAVMFEGEIGQLDDPETLYRRPVSRRVAAFIGMMNFLDATIAPAGARVALDVAGLGRCEVPASQAPGGVPAGAATVGIRPETLAILFEGESAPGRVVDGVVDEVVYYGDMTYYDVRIPGHDAPLNISMKNLIGRPVLEVGAPARVAWDERALVLLAR